LFPLFLYALLKPFDQTNKISNPGFVCLLEKVEKNKISKFLVKFCAYPDILAVHENPPSPIKSSHSADVIRRESAPSLTDIRFKINLNNAIGSENSPKQLFSSNNSRIFLKISLNLTKFLKNLFFN